MQGKRPIITWQGNKRRAQLLAAALQDVLMAWNREVSSGQVDSAETNLVWLAASKLLRETELLTDVDSEMPCPDDGLTLEAFACSLLFEARSKKYAQARWLCSDSKEKKRRVLKMRAAFEAWKQDELQAQAGRNNIVPLEWIDCPCGRRYSNALICPHCGSR